MKWIALGIALMAVPVISGWARGRDDRVALLATIVAFLPFFNVDVYLVSDPSYRGDTRGLELGLVDLAGLALWWAMPAAGRLPDRLLRAAFLLAVLASVAQAARPEFALYGVAKLVRMYAIGAVAARAGRTGHGPALLRGLAFGLIYAAVVALQQRYLDGRLQATGPFVHQNGLGMTANLIAPVLLSLLLVGQGGRLVAIALACAALSVILSLSRGAMTMLPLACAVVYVGSMRRRYTPRKLVILLIALLGAALVLGKSLDTIVDRFLHAPETSGEGRERFEEAAHLMLADHPLGVGLNQYSWVLAHDGYGARVDLPPPDRDGLVHNYYWLTAAEAGWPGLVLLLLIMAAPLVRALAGVGRHWRTPSVRGDLLLGLAAGILVTYLHSTLEWALRITPISQVLWILYGLIAAIARPASR